MILKIKVNKSEELSIDVFINKKPLRIMIISFSENENGEVKGAIYQKPVRE